MKIQILVIAFALMSSLPCLGQADEVKGHAKGTIIGKGDQPTVHFVKLEKELQYYYFTGNYKGKKTTVLWSKLKEFEYLNDTSVRMTLRTGKTFTLTETSRPSVYFYYYDEINEKLTQDAVSGSAVHKIVFDTHIGSVKKCPKCNRQFPEDYLFCPHDKTDLDWSKVE